MRKIGKFGREEQLRGGSEEIIGSCKIHSYNNSQVECRDSNPQNADGTRILPTMGIDVQETEVVYFNAESISAKRERILWLFSRQSTTVRIW